jgi:hypothetical protein
MRQVLALDIVRELIKNDPPLRKAIKAEARKNFSMSAARRPRNLMGLKNEDNDHVAKRSRDLKKKYGTGGKGGGDSNCKKDKAVDLLSEMQHLFDRDVRGLAPETKSSKLTHLARDKSSRIASKQVYPIDEE